MGEVLPPQGQAIYRSWPKPLMLSEHQAWRVGLEKIVSKYSKTKAEAWL